jgi:uncharacterized protein
MKKNNTVNSDNPPFRVLTIDGGGMRGLYSATLLQVLARRFDKQFINDEPDIGSAFDLICGTSTGSILSCGLAAGIPLESVRSLYVDHGRVIFSDPMPKNTEQSRFKLPALWRWMWRQRTSPSSNADALYHSLHSSFGDETIGQLYRRRGIRVCVPAVNAANHRAVVFKTPHVEMKHAHNDWEVVDVCMASSAAPIFMPIFKTDDPNDKHLVNFFVDGGLWASNPVMVGLIEALQITACKQPIHIISVGTCSMPTGDPLSVQLPEWGLQQWRVGVGITEMTMSAQASGSMEASVLLAQSLRNIGLDIQIIRLKESGRSAKEYDAIGLDRADHLALSTLISLATRDADLIHSKSLTDQTRAQVLSDIFNHLSPLSQTLKETSNV